MDTASWSPLLLSLRAAGLALLLLSPPAIGAALLVRSWHGPRRALADLLLLSPLVLPPTVLGFLLLQLLGPDGAVGKPLQAAGISVVFHWSATVISAAVVAFPLMYRSTLASLEQLDPAFEAVALSLGCPPLQAFRRVTLPLILPGLLAGLSLSLARALGEFGTTMMLAGNIPGRTQTLPLAIYSAVESGSLAEAWRLTAIVLLLNGGCLALVEGLTRRQPPPLGPRDPRDADPQESRVAVSASPPKRPPALAALEVTLQLQRGGFSLDLHWSSQVSRLAVLGPSGAGKSLLLRCIAGLERPQHGRMQLGSRLLCDTDAGVWVAPQHRRIAMVFQQPALFPHLTVAANVAFGLSHLSSAQRRSRVAELLTAVGLEEQARLFPNQLSGGQGQRVALARALAIEPDLLLLDEPLNAQDSFRRRRLQHWIEDVQRRTGTPILLVTHDSDEARRLSDELLILEGGRLLHQGPTDRLLAQPGLLAVAQLTGCDNLSPIHWLDANRLHAVAWDLVIDGARDAARGPVDWIGLRAHHLRLRPAGATPACSRRIVRRCQLIQVSQGAQQVSVYVQIGAGTIALEVELRSWEWRELQSQQEALELVIPREEILWLRS